MKHLFTLLIAVALLPSCKKKIEARDIIIKVYNCEADMKVESNGGPDGGSFYLKPGESYFIGAPGKTPYTIIADGDSANLSLELIVNSRTVYHQTGKHHEVGL